MEDGFLGSRMVSTEVACGEGVGAQYGCHRPPLQVQKTRWEHFGYAWCRLVPLIF
jgi:hypothetical protein